jgi:uncharacterized protein involved in exopolysaccharide biosynthesis
MSVGNVTGSGTGRLSTGFGEAEAAEIPPLSLASVGVVLLRYRYLIAVAVFAVSTLLVSAGLLAHRTYTATASFVPQTTDKGLSRLAGLAAQFGVVGLPTGNGPSPEFYADVMTSRQLLRAVVDTRFPADSGGSILLADLLRAPGSGTLRRERTVDRLLRAVGVVTSNKTGMVELDVRLPDPVIAQQVAHRMLELLNDFNLRTRQSQARQERLFAGRRMDEVRGELRTAENALQAFLQQNRDFEDSPQLAFQRDRLQREVSLRQQVYTSLATSYEQSKMDEVRDTPVITVVETPVVPVEPDSRRLIVRGVVGVTLGLMLGVLLAFGREYGRRNREAGDTTYEDFVVLQREAVDDLKRPLRLLRRGR